MIVGGPLRVQTEKLILISPTRKIWFHKIEEDQKDQLFDILVPQFTARKFSSISDSGQNSETVNV